MLCHSNRSKFLVTSKLNFLQVSHFCYQLYRQEQNNTGSASTWQMALLCQFMLVCLSTRQPSASLVQESWWLQKITLGKRCPFQYAECAMHCCTSQRLKQTLFAWRYVLQSLQFPQQASKKSAYGPAHKHERTRVCNAMSWQKLLASLHECSLTHARKSHIILSPPIHAQGSCRLVHLS